MICMQQGPTRTFSQRLARNALFWGIPMVLLELWGKPFWSWGVGLLIVAPATLVGMVAMTVLEHMFVSIIKKREVR